MLLLLALASGGCVPAAARAPLPIALSDGDAAVADRLFFGRSIPGGGLVTDEEWTAFVREVVTPRFPDGFTVWQADGQWRGPAGEVVREPVMVLEVVHPGAAEAEVALEEIAREYRRRFRQEAVLRVTVPARLRFYE